MEAHEAAVAAHLAQHAMAAALAAGATPKEAYAAGQAASDAFTGADSSFPMLDLNATRQNNNKEGKKLRSGSPKATSNITEDMGKEEPISPEELDGATGRHRGPKLHHIEPSQFTLLHHTTCMPKSTWGYTSGEGRAQPAPQ
jgi:hypothetical protein